MSSVYFECFRKCLGWSGQGIADESDYNNFKVSLDISKMGTDVVIVKSGQRICGTGGALANTPVVQDKAYFECKLQSTGIWGIGLALETANLSKIPLGSCDKSWVLRHDGEVWHNNTKIQEIKTIPTESDVIGISYNHIEMKIYINGKSLDVSVTGIKGKVYPVVYVDESAILDVQFTNFYFTPPSGFREILVEQQIF